MLYPVDFPSPIVIPFKSHVLTSLPAKFTDADRDAGKRAFDFLLLIKFLTN